MRGERDEGKQKEMKSEEKSEEKQKQRGTNRNSAAENSNTPTKL